MSLPDKQNVGNTVCHPPTLQSRLGPTQLLNLLDTEAATGRAEVSSRGGKGALWVQALSKTEIL